MARKEIVVFTDDVTGEPCDEVTTVVVVWAGATYEVDMSPETLQRYGDAIAPFVTKGRRVGTRGTVLRPAFGAARAPKPSETRADNKIIRDWWGRNQGRAGVPPLSEYGRIANDVRALFEVHGGRDIPEASKPPVEAAKTPRKAGTVGAEVKVSAAPATFTEPATPSVAKSTTKRTATAKVTATAAKRTGRRAAS